MPVMLIGHGGWDVKGEPAYALMPRATSITFYTENFKLLEAGSAAEIVSLSQVFQDAEPNQTVEGFKWAPNYTLSQLEPEPLQYMKDSLHQDVTAVFVEQDTRLCEGDGSRCGDGFHDCSGLLARRDVVGQQLYWVACRHVALNEAGGIFAGANQGSLGLGPDAELVPLVDSAGLTQPGQEFWEQFETISDDQKLQDWHALPDTDQASLRKDERIQTWWETQVR